MSARVIPDLKPNEDYKLECEEIFKIIQQWALCGLDFVFSWNWYSYRPWEGEDTALCTLNRAFLYIHLLLVYRVTCIKLCQHAGWSLHFRGNFIRSPGSSDHPSSRDPGMQKTPGGPDYQDAASWHSSGASWQSIRPGSHDGHSLQSWHRTRSPLPGTRGLIITE